MQRLTSPTASEAFHLAAVMCHLPWRHMCFFLIQRAFPATCWPPPPHPPESRLTKMSCCEDLTLWKLAAAVINTRKQHWSWGCGGGSRCCDPIRGASCCVCKRSEFGVANGRWFQPSSLRALLVYIYLYVSITIIYIYMDTYTIYIYIYGIYSMHALGCWPTWVKKIVGVTSLRSEGFMLNTLMKWKWAEICRWERVHLRGLEFDVQTKTKDKENWFGNLSAVASWSPSLAHPQSWRQCQRPREPSWEDLGPRWDRVRSKDRPGGSVPLLEKTCNTLWYYWYGIVNSVRGFSPETGVPRLFDFACIHSKLIGLRWCQVAIVPSLPTK